MRDFDSIAHLDFSVPTELTSDAESIQFESFEAKRIQLVQTFIDHVYVLNDMHGLVYLADEEAYADRLFQLEELVREDMENFGLFRGDLIQANVPNLVYPAGFTAEFDAGEAVRAQFEGLAIYPHYDIAADGQPAELLPFSMNISVTEPVAIGPHGSTSLESIGDMNPLISLHHSTIDLHRVILPS